LQKHWESIKTLGSNGASEVSERWQALGVPAFAKGYGEVSP
jgi:hypothetical protein